MNWRLNIVIPLGFGTLALLGFWRLNAAGAVTPLTATRSLQQYESDQQGHTRLVREETGTFSRAANGDEAIRMNDAKTGEPISTQVRANGKSVSITHKTHTYTVSAITIPVTSDIVAAATAQMARSAQQHTLINGIWTREAPIKDANSGKIGGKVWSAVDYPLLVIRREMELPPWPSGRSAGNSTKIVEELSNVQIGAVPDPKLFVLPPLDGYTQIGCQGCPPPVLKK